MNQAAFWSRPHKLTLSSYRHEKPSDKKWEQNPQSVRNPQWGSHPACPVLHVLHTLTGSCHLTCDAISCTKRAEGQYFLSVPCGFHCGCTEAVFQRTKAIHHKWIGLFSFPIGNKSHDPSQLSLSSVHLSKAPQLQATTCSWNNQSPPDRQSPTRGRKPHGLLWWLSSSLGKRFQDTSMQARLISVQFPQGNTLLHESLSPKSPSHLTSSSKRKIKCKVCIFHARFNEK